MFKKARNFINSWNCAIKGLILLALLLMPFQALAKENIFWLKQSDPLPTPDGTGKYIYQIMEGDKPVSPAAIKVLEAGWWYHPNGSAARRKYKARYINLPVKPDMTELELLVPYSGRANVLVRFERNNVIYTTQLMNFLYGQGSNAQAFLEAKGDQEPTKPYVSNSSGRPMMNMRPDFYLRYNPIQPKAYSVKAYDDDLELEGSAKSDNRGNFAYKAKPIPRLQLTPDKRNYRRQFVIADQEQGKAYVTSFNVGGYRYRNAYMELGQGIGLAVAAMLITAGGLWYYIKRRLKHVSD